MELHLTRDIFAQESTTGTLTVDGKSFGFVLEDVDRGLDAADPATLPKKVKARTAIPVGRYRVKTTWSPKYARPVPQVLDVPGFQGIRIHSGSKAEDTEGCLLPGTKRGVGFVGNSRAAAKWLERAITEAEARGEEVFVTIDRDVKAWAAFNNPKEK